MSFDTYEHSLAAGQPVWLYQFKRGVMRWNYSSSARTEVHNNEYFEPVKGGIADSGMRRTGEVSADRLTITAPADLDVAQLYRAVPPSAPIQLVIREKHVGSTEARVVWNGEIESVGWPQLDRCEIKALPLTASLDVPGLRGCWDRSCGASVYDRRCGLARESYRVDLYIQSLTGTSISSGTAAAQAAGWFSGGIVEWPIGQGEYERRTVLSHSGSTLVLLNGTAGLAAGTTVRAYPGCNLTATMCHTRFVNLDRFRGDPNMMARNLFDGNPVF